MLRLTRKFLMVFEIFSYQKMIKNEALSLKMEKLQCKWLQERNCTSKTENEPWYPWNTVFERIAHKYFAFFNSWLTNFHRIYSSWLKKPYRQWFTFENYLRKLSFLFISAMVIGSGIRHETDIKKSLNTKNWENTVYPKWNFNCLVLLIVNPLSSA